MCKVFLSLFSQVNAFLRVFQQLSNAFHVTKYFSSAIFSTARVVNSAILDGAVNVGFTTTKSFGAAPLTIIPPPLRLQYRWKHYHQNISLHTIADKFGNIMDYFRYDKKKNDNCNTGSFKGRDKVAINVALGQCHLIIKVH